MATNTITRNPWISSTPIAMQITAADIEQRRSDLYAWSIEHNRPLPMPAEWIIGLELRGYTVDLDTGERTAPASTPATFSPTSAGLAAGRPWPTNGGAK